MPGKNEAKFTFTADTKEFTEAVSRANSTMTKLRSELKLNEAQMKNTGQSVEGLAKSKSILEQQDATLSAKVDALTSKYERACQIFGENSNEAQKLATQINGVMTAQERVRAQIESTTQAIEEQKAAQGQAESAYGQLSAKIDQQRADVSALEKEYASAVIQFGKTSDEARELGSRLSQMGEDLRKSEKDMGEATTAAKKLAGGFDDASDSAKEGKNSITELAAGGLITGFAQDAISSLTGLVDATQDYRNEQNKLKAIAETSGQSLDTLKDGYQDLYAITADSTLSSTAVANMTAMSLSTEQTNSLVEAATGIWAQYGDSIPLDGLMEAVNETSKVGLSGRRKIAESSGKPKAISPWQPEPKAA